MMMAKALCRSDSDCHNGGLCSSTEFCDCVSGASIACLFNLIISSPSGYSWHDRCQENPRELRTEILVYQVCMVTVFSVMTILALVRLGFSLITRWRGHHVSQTQLLALFTLAVSTALFAVSDMDPFGDLQLVSARTALSLSMLSFNFDLLALGVIVRMFVAIQAKFEARTRAMLPAFDFLLLSLCVIMWIPVVILVHRPTIVLYFYLPVTLFYLAAVLVALSVGAVRVLRFASEQRDFDNQNSAYAQATRRLLRLAQVSRWFAVLVILFIAVTDTLLGDSFRDRLIVLWLLHLSMVFLLGVGLVVVGRPAQVSSAPQQRTGQSRQTEGREAAATVTAPDREHATAPAAKSRAPSGTGAHRAFKIVVQETGPPGPGRSYAPVRRGESVELAVQSVSAKPAVTGSKVVLTAIDPEDSCEGV